MDEILIVTFWHREIGRVHWLNFIFKKNQVHNNITCEVIDLKVLI
jgi:hypothetical protein